MRLPDSDAELLNECDLETFTASGKGGQHVNRDGERGSLAAIARLV